jgi:heme-degrading monooxygenase HmoA
MIVRSWRGATRTADAERYATYIRETGLRAIGATAGNRGALILQRNLGPLSEVVVLSFWESREVIRAFASEPIERAVFYPEDDTYLVERDLEVRHYEVSASVGPVGSVLDDI